MIDDSVKNSILKIPTTLQKEVFERIIFETLSRKIKILKEDSGGGSGSTPGFDYFFNKVRKKAVKPKKEVDASEILGDIEDSLEKLKDNVFSGKKDLEREIDQRIEDRLTSIGKTINGSKKDINILINFIIHAERLVSFFALNNPREYPDEYSGGYVATNLSKQINLEVTNLVNTNNKNDNVFLLSFGYYINHNAKGGVTKVLEPKTHSEFVGAIREFYKGGNKEKDADELEKIFFNENDADLFKRYLKEFDNMPIMKGSIPEISEFTDRGVDQDKTPYKLTEEGGKYYYDPDAPEIVDLNKHINELLKIEI